MAESSAAYMTASLDTSHKAERSQSLAHSNEPRYRRDHHHSCFGTLQYTLDPQPVFINGGEFCRVSGNKALLKPIYGAIQEFFVPSVT